METIEKQSDLILLKRLQDIISKLNELDNQIESNSKRQSETDLELSDWLHIIEDYELSDSASIEVIKKIHELRKKRRAEKNEFELISKYQEIKNRLSSSDNRQFMISEIQKKFKTLNQEYNYRVLTNDEVNYIINLKNSVAEKQEDKSKRGRKKTQKSEETNQMIKELLKQRYSQSAIAKELGISQPSIAIRIKKMKENGIL